MTAFDSPSRADGRDATVDGQTSPKPRLEERLLEAMTWPEVKAVAELGVPVVLPLGSTEQHGPHLPLNTDCILPTAIALKAAEQYPLIIAPPIRYGAKSRPLTGGGETFPGTLSLELMTIVGTVQQVIEGLVRSGFRKICLQGFHYENQAVAWSAADLAHRNVPEATILVLESAMPTVAEPELTEIFGEGFAGWEFEHAAHAETSMMMAVRPDLVRADQIVDDAAARSPKWDVIPPPADFIPKSGVLSRASLSNAEAGERLLELAAAKLVQALTAEFGSPVAGGGRP
jgi:creatinine amidohydrolase